MIRAKNSKWIKLIIVGGLFITLYGCGNSSGYHPGDYKANNAVDSGNDPVSVTNTAPNPAAMGVGDVYTVTFSDKSPGTIDFSGVDSSAQFILAVGSIDTVMSSKMVQMSDESVELGDMDLSATPLESDGWSDMDAKAALDQRLRGIEMELSLDPNAEKASTGTGAAGAMKAMVSGKAESPLPKIGDVEQFKVLAGLSSLTSFKSIQGRVECVGDNVIFYVDTQVYSVNPSDLTNSDVLSLCTEFDRIAAKEYEIFGEPSDINGDGRVAVLMTPQVNRLGAMGGGIITGFFFANDLYAGSNSNYREIIYVMVPDSGGSYGVEIPKSFAMDNLLPAVLPHELQHAINFNQKVFVAGGSSEESWLNEGLSHLAEDLVGYGQENPSRIEVFMANPSYYGPISPGSPGLAERGAAYLFLRFLYEQAADGRAFIWNLLHSNMTGPENLQAAFAGTSSDLDQVSEFLLRWNIAMVMSSFNLSSDPRFSYAGRVFNAETGHYHGVCLNCNTEDGRGTVLNGITLSTYYGVSQIELEPTATQYYKIPSFPQQIRLAANTQGNYGATLIRFK